MKLFFIMLTIIMLGFSEIRDPFTSANTPSALPILERYTIRLQQRDPEQLLKTLPQLYPQALFSAISETKQLCIRCTPQQWMQIKETIHALDLCLEQVHIEIKILEINTNQLNTLGFRWNTTDDSISISKELQQPLLDKINALIASGNATLLANPKITTIIGQAALINIGDQLPYATLHEQADTRTWQINYLATGISLEILPIDAQSDIQLHIKPMLKTIKQWKQTPGGEYPILSSRQVETKLHVKNGEQFILAGLLANEERNSLRKIPILGDIPLLGVLFCYQEKETQTTDIVFIIKASKV